MVITATTPDATRPTLAFYINGELNYTEVNGWLPQNGATTSNYIGRSNWANSTSGAANPDELFRGQLFDFRGYNKLLNKAKVKEIYQWGKPLLGLT